MEIVKLANIQQNIFQTVCFSSTQYSGLDFYAKNKALVATLKLPQPSGMV
jgi:hypothetical protein